MGIPQKGDMHLDSRQGLGGDWVGLSPKNGSLIGRALMCYYIVFERRASLSSNNQSPLI